MKTFDEVFNEIKSNVSVSKAGKIKKTFSRTDFDTLFCKTDLRSGGVLYY